MTQRFTAGVATGILLTGLLGFAALTIHTPTTAAAGKAGSPSASPTSSTVAPAKSLDAQKGQRIVQIKGKLGMGLLGKGFPGMMDPLSQPDVIVTVAAVNGQTITATLGGGKAIIAKAALGGGGQVFIGKPGMEPGDAQTITETITVSATTTITRAEQAASLSDIQPGSILVVHGQPTGANTFAASSIEIVLPDQTGVVTAINGTTATITGFDARVYTVALGNTTVYRRADQSATLADLTVGSLIDVEGTLNVGTSTINAMLVTIHLPQVAGPVTAINGNDLSIQAGDNTTTTVHLTDSTTYHAGKQGTASRSSITTNSIVIATGTLNSDGSLTALSVNVIPLPTPGDAPSIMQVPGSGMGGSSFGVDTGPSMGGLSFGVDTGPSMGGSSFGVDTSSGSYSTTISGPDGAVFSFGQ